MRMKTGKLILAAMLGCLCVGGVGCDSNDDADSSDKGQADEIGDRGDGKDAEPPEVALLGLESYQAVRGIEQLEVQAVDNVAVVKLELLVNEELASERKEKPFAFSWDTTKSSDGPVNLTVRATDEAGNVASSDLVRVVIVNGGVEIRDFEEGPVATMTIPADYDGTQETHVKHHFIPEADFTRALCVALWENPVGGTPWNLTAEMGTGTCPHSGVAFEGSAQSETGAVEFDAIPAEGVAKDVRHFCHVGAENAGEHLGEQLEITYKVFLFGALDDMRSCPLNSAFPCRCDGVLKCEDGSDCVGFLPEKNGGACASTCEGEEDTTSCTATQGFGLYGFCGASKKSGPATHCVVVCSEEGETASCPPDLTCDPQNGVCMPNY